ncbi:hypothetical protein BDW02DRAFT_650611 [Decorospora gaudefroyi]|uniref:Uncharacterized protein n=1 Tax=Decorospora gaudefroyi TaxID=184978 RepID=A0A6A5K6N3_9PLEO|nr:hypothetical protein BDW02DRAFT_650611 [Decorospora gaudefroyi]
MSQRTTPTKRNAERKNDNTTRASPLNWLRGKPFKAIKYTVSAAIVALVGPLVMQLDLGLTTAFWALISTILAGRCLNKNFVAGVATLLNTYGLDGSEGHTLAMVGFVGLNIVFDDVRPDSQVFGDEFFGNVERVTRAVTGFFVRMVASTWGIPRALCRTLWSVVTNVLVLVSHLFAGLTWTMETLYRNWCRFFRSLKELQKLRLPEHWTHNERQQPLGQDTRKTKWRRLSDVAQNIVLSLSTDQRPTEDSAEQLLEDWEFVEAEAKLEAEHNTASAVHTDSEGEHQEALFDEVMRLIDSCDGLSGIDWDGVMGDL